MSPKLTIVELREEISEVLAINEKSYHLPEICVALGLKEGTIEEAHSSKRSYVRNRIVAKGLSELINFSELLLERYSNAEDLASMVQLFSTQAGGVSGDIKNLIFSADGPKPEIVLTDALNNTIEIVQNAEYCLVYDLPILSSGLLWQELLEWWIGNCDPKLSRREVEENLFVRLRKSLSSSPPEILFFNTYFKCFHSTLGKALPALIPQVYLHYDPKTFKDLNGQIRLQRQRMDFLLLLPDNQRVVIEIDGKQHYSEENTSSPRKYSEMVSEDRKLRLLGYEVYRFGGYELMSSECTENGEALIQGFFERLFAKHQISLIST